MHEVKIAGSDLSYFASIVQSALAGDYGDLSEVTVTVHDTGQLQFSTNDVATGHFGDPVAPLVGEVTNLLSSITVNNAPEGTGNPYANVQDGDPANVLPRLDRLERIAEGVATALGLGLPKLDMSKL